MKKTSFLISLLSLIILSGYGQISNYTYTQSMANASQWLGGPIHYRLKPATLSTNPLKCIYVGDTIGANVPYLTGNGFAIGFNFTYNNEVFDRFAVGGNGYIKLGKTGEPIYMPNDTLPGTIFDNSPTHKNIIAAFQTNAAVIVPSSNDNTLIELEQTGLPGSRVLVIHFLHFNPGRVLMEYQIQLFEENNQVVFAYGSFTASSSINAKAAVGITGNSDFVNRSVTAGTNTWQTSAQGTSNLDACDFKNGCVPPAPGVKILTYTWQPPTPSPSAPVCPSAFFLVDESYPGSIYTGAGSSSYYYVFADQDTNVVTNPTLRWSNVALVSHQATTYDLYFDTDNPPSQLLAQNLTATSYALPALVSNTKYYYKIVPQNNSGIANTCTGTFTTASTLQYCDLQVQGAGYINSFTLNTLSYSRNSSNELIYKFPATAPYTTSLQRNVSYTCSVTLSGQSVSLPWSNASVRIFIDFNQDGDFTDADETIIGGSGGPTISFTFNVSIPITAKLGTTTMRVCSKNAADLNAFTSCGTYSWGGRQDYIINITPASGCESFSISPSINTISCFGQNDGSIALNPSGGNSPYSVTWTDGNALSYRTDLSKNAYKASIIDATGCEITTSLIAITQPAKLGIDTSSTNNTTIVNVSGGTTPYGFLWSNGSTTQNTTELPSGIYSLTVTDAHGCDTTMENISIKNPATETLNSQETVFFYAYPNPTTGILKLKLSSPSHAQLSNTQGIILKETDYINEGILDLSDLPESIYILKASNIQTTSIIKILKK